MSILDKAKPNALYNFVSYERLYRSIVFEHMRKAKEARCLAMLSVAAPYSYAVGGQAK